MLPVYTILPKQQMERPTKRQRTAENGVTAGQDFVDLSSAAADLSQDLYMETVNRAQLDFDQERVCSVTLSNMNVYSCLVCGKYYAGRSKSTPAFFHSLDEEHHVFLNLTTLKVYILPDAYENTNKALDDIKYAASPSYTKAQVVKLDRNTSTSYDVSRVPYRAGFVGINTISSTAHCGIMLQALSHVGPLRNHLLLSDVSNKSDLVQSYALLVRKLWSDKLLKSHTSPHETIRHAQALQPPSGLVNKVHSFSTFLLNHLHKHLRTATVDGGDKQSSIVSSSFQGQLTIESQAVFTVQDESRQETRTRFESSSKIDRKESKFMFLTVNLPPTPLFQDDVAKSAVPQISLAELLARYNGAQVEELSGSRRRFILTHLPPFLTIYIPRESRLDFATERNRTVVNFPLKGLDMSPYLASPKDDRQGPTSTIYNLLFNVTHEVTLSSSGEENHIYRLQVRDKALDKWMQLEGLLVQEIKRDMLNVGAPTVLQIWERRV